MRLELKQQFQIESARRLPHLPPQHPCSKVHGHGFKIILTIHGEKNSHLGWVIDYNDIEKQMRPLLKQIDHQLLNEVPGLENPTTENLCIWLYEKGKQVLPGLVQVTIQETPTTECSYPIL